jgi:hypothetical protein
MKKLLGLFLIACVSAVLGLGSTGCTKKTDTKTPDKAKVTTPPKDGKDDKKEDVAPKDDKKVDDKKNEVPPPPPPPKDDKKKEGDKKGADDKKDNGDDKKGAALSRESITVASLSPAVLNTHVSRYLVQ